MISALNEQLQQELEYTLLKPDCHCWWISKMQSGREDTLEERYAIKVCFKLEKKCHRNVWNASDCFSTIEHQFLSCIRDSRKAGSLWGMMRGVGGVRKSIHESWLAKGLGLGLLCWGFKGVQEEIPSEEASTLQIVETSSVMLVYVNVIVICALYLWLVEFHLLTSFQFIPACHFSRSNISLLLPSLFFFVDEEWQRNHNLMCTFYSLFIDNFFLHYLLWPKQSVNDKIGDGAFDLTRWESFADKLILTSGPFCSSDWNHLIRADVLDWSRGCQSNRLTFIFFHVQDLI